MSEVNLDDAKIKYEDHWYSAEDLTAMIQEKMQSGEMKFAGIAAALEELNKAMENSHTLDVRLVLTAEVYQKLTELGGAEEKEAVHKAVMAAISRSASETTGAPPRFDQGKRTQTAIRCPQCKAPIIITSRERPLIVECNECGAAGRLTAENKWAVLDA